MSGHDKDLLDGDMGLLHWVEMLIFAKQQMTR